MSASTSVEEGLEFTPRFDEKGLIMAIAQDADTGQILKVRQILVDCDQDCLILKVTVEQGQCHVGYQSCFYRALKKNSENDLEFIAEKIYDPNKVYQE